MFDKINGRKVIASISGGKDSAALSLHLHELGIEHERVHMLTGWDSQITMDYIRGPLTDKIGPIKEIGYPGGMEALVLKKGMFPSRVRRFCTQFLKIYPMRDYIEAMVSNGHQVINAVGIRADESVARRDSLEWEPCDWAPCETWRPLVKWSVQDVIDIHRRHNLAPNPLYMMGAERVGCWPCIFARKGEIRMMHQVDPSFVDRIESLELANGYTWFHEHTSIKIEQVCKECSGSGELKEAPCDKCDGHGVQLKSRGKPWPIRKAVEWSMTSRGGRQFELFTAPDEQTGCMRWGLCDTGGHKV